MVGVLNISWAGVDYRWRFENCRRLFLSVFGIEVGRAS